MTELNFELPDDERGVSPVIGIIRMVANTVILAAVIASVTWISQGNADKLNVTVSGTASFEGAGGDGNLTSVGDSVRIVNATASDVTITVTAIGSSGSRTVVTQEALVIGQGN